MNTIDIGGCGRLYLSKSGKWLIGAVLLGIGFSTSTGWAQSSETRFGFVERQAGFSQGYGVYSTTAFPAVNTYGFKHAALAVEKGKKVALLSSSGSSLPSSNVNTGASVPPPNLMVVSGRSASSASRAATTSAPRRRLFARNTESGVSKDGFYILSRTNGNPPKSQTANVRSTTTYSESPAKKRLGLRNLFRRR
tara:strand:- start:1282 stop:1863 length:582 start_codon:yes stop_codon:yes gene_type:complete